MPTFHGTIVVYDVEVFIPVMMAPDLGFKFGSQQTTPSEILSDPRATLFYPQGYLRPGTTLANAAAQADALGATAVARAAAHRCRAAAAGRARSGDRRAARRCHPAADA